MKSKMEKERALEVTKRAGERKRERKEFLWGGGEEREKRERVKR